MTQIYLLLVTWALVNVQFKVQKLYFLKTPIFSKQLHTFSQELLFQKMLFFRIGNLVFTVTLSIYHSVINATNIGVFRLKLPVGAQIGCTTPKIFLLIPWKKYFSSNLLSQGSHERDFLLKDVKNSVFGILTKI